MPHTAFNFATLGSGGVVGFVLAIVGGGDSIIIAVPMMVYADGISNPHVAIGTSRLLKSSPADKRRRHGRHERIHRTMRAETVRPPAPCRNVQQVRFNIFRREYNQERPHEVLGQMTPASHWRPCRRFLPVRTPEPGLTPVTRSAACAATARSNGAASTSSSTRRWLTNQSASPSTARRPDRPLLRARPRVHRSRRPVPPLPSTARSAALNGGTG